MAKKSKNSPASTIVKRSPKEERLFQNLLKTTQQFIEGKSYRPMSAAELSNRLHFAPQHDLLFDQIMDSLIQQNILSLQHGKYHYNKIPVEELMTGTLRLHPRGFGFVQADNAVRYPQDVFIPKHLTQNAIDGDKVTVVVNQEVFSEKGPEGKIVSILKRKRTHVAGIIQSVDKHGDINAYVPMLGEDQRVVVMPSKKKKLIPGDRIVMEVVEWGSKETETRCRFSEYIGHISDPSCDIKAAIIEYELRAEFAPNIVEEAEQYGKQVSRKDMQSREDLRDIECFTIDPDTAKDFDDALSLFKDKKGHYHLSVHIADVSHYVHPGSALDVEARMRCNSTYFPGFCLPMLPSALSDNLCSLKPNVNRLAVSVHVEYDKEGNRIQYRIARSVIKSAKRFSYKEAKAVLDGKRKSAYTPTLKLMVELCGLLKRKRYERGSIEFSLPELVVIVDEKGVPYKTDYVEYDITHQLVEEFMLQANELVATHLSEQGKNLTYRVHDVPAEEHMRDFAALVAAFGFQLPEKPTPLELQQLFDEALHTPYGPYLATSYIRRMRVASYSADNIGHYGLSLTHYCHFTSPIRRYVDLVAHRLLFGETDDRKMLEDISKECSEKERISAKAENNVVLLKKLRLLQTIHESDPQRQYEAVVTRVKNFGITFEILDLMLEGFLHVSELDGDYYVFEENKMRLRGVYRGGGYHSGDKITVMLKEVDLVLLLSSWSLVSGDGSARKERSSSKKRTKSSSKKKRPEKQGKRHFGPKAKKNRRKK